MTRLLGALLLALTSCAHDAPLQPASASCGSSSNWGLARASMVPGGASLARSLVRTGLVDEYELLVHPVVIGRGQPIFTEIEQPTDLKLVKSKVFRTGANALIYAPR